MMKIKNVCFVICLFAVLSVNSEVSYGQGQLPLVPEPVSVIHKHGNFELSGRTKIVALKGEGVFQIADMFRKQLLSLSGISLEISRAEIDHKSNRAVVFSLNKTRNKRIGEEGYKLEITSCEIRISANKASGLFYGVQTLLQLVPAQKDSKAFVPCALILDYPRFAWRGLMLDVSRHFSTKEEVEKFIDQMSKYKYNTFHWHLSDNNGWRIEIKSYPKLTSIGAWRVPRTGVYGSFEPPIFGEKATDGGFYTQADIREVVKYAQERFVTIVPEIDVPGHSMALIAAYPSMSCTGEKYSVYPGSKDGVGDNVLCPGNDSVFKMLNSVFGEIAFLFPGKYIHIGGDEVGKNFWENCPKCQIRMKEEHLNSSEELQSYFIRRVSKILASKGKELIGWDEILEGGLAPDATVMSWRGTEGGIAAAKSGHHVVMTPTQYCYFDYMQGDPVIERYGGAHLGIKQVYQFNPVPLGVDSSYVLGGQGNIWTEMIPNFRRVEYMTWPRALALSEDLWSPKGNRNWDEFVPRMEAQFPRFKVAEVNYDPSIYDPEISMVKTADGDSRIVFTSEIKGLDIYYTFDCTFPDKFSAKYDGNPIKTPKGSTEIWAITYRDGNPIGRLLVITFDELKRR
jgi:hexosaminidase